AKIPGKTGSIIEIDRLGTGTTGNPRADLHRLVLPRANCSDAVDRMADITNGKSGGIDVAVTLHKAAPLLEETPQFLHGTLVLLIGIFLKRGRVGQVRINQTGVLVDLRQRIIRIERLIKQCTVMRKIAL